MPTDTTGVMPRATQPVIALGVAVALAAMAAWYASLGGFSGRVVRHDDASASTTGFTVNVNEAGLDELAILPGLGPATAQSIVDHRRAHGPFATVDDLLDVPGIGPSTLERIRPHIRPIRQRPPAP